MSQKWAVGSMGCRNNGPSEQWAVEILGCRNNDLTPLIQGLLNLYGFPSAVLIHCGGNDIGHTETPCGLLTYQITFVSLFIEILPGSPIIWSSILPRIKWRLSKNTANMEKHKEANQPSCQILLFEQKLLWHKISRFL